jgi:hypothetical protein
MELPALIAHFLLDNQGLVVFYTRSMELLHDLNHNSNLAKTKKNPTFRINLEMAKRLPAS